MNWEKAVSKMALMTKDNSLKWTAVGDTGGDDARFRRSGVDGLAYYARVLGKTFLIYRTSYRDYDAENDSWFDSGKVALEIVDEQGKRLMSLPTTTSEWELMSEVEAQQAGADEFLRDFLRE